MSVRKCGHRLNRVFLRAPVELRAASRRTGPAGTRGRCRSPSREPGIWSGQRVRASRSRRSSSTASGTSTRNGRMSSDMRPNLSAYTAAVRLPARRRSRAPPERRVPDDRGDDRDRSAHEDRHDRQHDPQASSRVPARSNAQSGYRDASIATRRPSTSGTTASSTNAERG